MTANRILLLLAALSVGACCQASAEESVVVWRGTNPPNIYFVPKHDEPNKGDYTGPGFLLVITWASQQGDVFDSLHFPDRVTCDQAWQETVQHPPKERGVTFRKAECVSGFSDMAACIKVDRYIEVLRMEIRTRFKCRNSFN